MSGRLYLRVDDFPAWTESMDRFVPAEEFAKFHEILRAHRVPYLIAVTPQPAVNPLNRLGTDDRQLNEVECAIIRSIQEQGATIGLHGVTHRTRRVRPHSEFISLDDSFFAERIRYGDLELRRLTGVHAQVFVPPFNRLSSSQLEHLSRRFRVVCGGPESTPTIGQVHAFRLPSGALYLPSYPPLYGRAHEISAALARATRAATDEPVCLTLHWEWERRRGYSELERLCDALQGKAGTWGDLIDAEN